MYPERCSVFGHTPKRKGWRKALFVLCSVISFSVMANLGMLINVFIFTGLDTHFVHVKPPRLPEGRAAKPLLMVHGWPGSFYEFYKIIPLLTDPASHGLGDEHIFEVICPSIPGYGFSEAPHKKGRTQKKKLSPHKRSLTEAASVSRTATPVTHFLFPQRGNRDPVCPVGGER